MAERNQNIHVLFTRAELQQLDRNMSRIGITNRSAYIRQMALRGYFLKLDPSDIRTLITLLRRASNNLNQYARKANTTGSIYRSDVVDLQLRFDEIFRLAKNIEGHLAKL